MKKKEIILGVVGIIVIVFAAYLVANLIHNYNQESVTEENDEQDTKDEEEEKIFEVDGVEITFKTYRVDEVFFINVPDIFTMLDEETLKSKYNYNDRPELVYESSDDLEHIFISTTDEDMADDTLETYLNERLAELTDATVLDSGIYQKYDKTFAKMVAYNESTYYNFRFFTIDNKLVTIEFNVPTSIYESWEEVVNEVMDSICFSEDDIKKYSSS